MKKRVPAYRSSIALCVACTLLILLSALLISRPSLVKKIQHRIYRSNQAARSLDLDQDLESQGMSPQGQLYKLDQVIAGQTEIMFSPSLLLVSPDHPLPPDYTAEIVSDSYTSLEMSPLVSADFQALSQAVNQEFEEKLYIASLFRSSEEQAEILAEDPDHAQPPGASEHQTGLAMDVYVFEYAGPNFINSPTGRWVNEHAWEYGFIVRYPSGREDLTGITFEPWHLRYVGKPHAEIIETKCWVLEEYLANLQLGKLYHFGDYFVIRTAEEEFRLPVGSQELKFSPDNLGSYVIWGRVAP